jgi:hypothetical protein
MACIWSNATRTPAMEGPPLPARLAPRHAGRLRLRPGLLATVRPDMILPVPAPRDSAAVPGCVDRRSLCQPTRADGIRNTASRGGGMTDPPAPASHLPLAGHGGLLATPGSAVMAGGGPRSTSPGGEPPWGMIRKMTGAR